MKQLALDVGAGMVTVGFVSTMTLWFMAMG